MESKKTPIFKQTVSEGDIDWLLCLQINSNRQFQKWLAPKLFGSKCEHIGAWRSVVEQSGESDLVWVVKSGDSRVLFALIENKLTAAAQPQQYERYRERGCLYKSEGKCDDFFTVLCAPEGYSSTDSEEYTIRITYESIRDWFSQNNQGGLKYFAYLMECAIAKSKEIKPPDPEITQFRRRIWTLANSEFPGLGLSEPSPGREYWVTQSYGDYSIRYKMLKKFGQVFRCVVDLELPDRGDDVEILSQRLGTKMVELGAEILRTGKSAAIRFDVPIVCPPHFDEEKVREALNVWLKLLTWWREHNRA